MTDQRHPRQEDAAARSFPRLLRDTVIAWFNANTPRLGAALAYYSILSLAPLLVVVVGIAGLVFGREAAEGHIVWQIHDFVGWQAAQTVQSLLRSAYDPSAGYAATGIGLLVLLFSASGVFAELRSSLNSVWGVQTDGTLLTMVWDRFFSFALVLAIGFLLLVSLVVSALVAAAGTYFSGLLPLSEATLHLVNTAVSLVISTVLFALLYKVVPDVRIDWRDVWVGAAVTAALFSVGKLVIGLYLGKATVVSAYGAAGSVVVILAWVYYSAQVFFLGAVFTRVYAERCGSRAPRRYRYPRPRPRAA